ncbi:hypothetical protein DJ526_09330, partial [Sulfolobus sp. A20-N-G8]
IINKSLSKNLILNIINVKEDELKFRLNEFDLAFIPLPLLNFIQGIKLISNGAFVIEKLGIKLHRDIINKICVKGSNSTEYYLFKALTNFKHHIEVVKGEDCQGADAMIDYDGYNISLGELWRQECGDLPIVISLIGSTRLSEGELLKIKAIIRESASIQENNKEILSYSKELGLKGRKAIECFFQICENRGLCKKNIKPYIL